MYISTKTYPHSLGISCCFRQWRADSHCNRLHGYALSFKFVFGADLLDDRNWVVDFGGLRDLKAALVHSFDHKTVVAKDDPQLPLFYEAERAGIMSLTVMPEVGCEAFAAHAFDMAKDWLVQQGMQDRVRVLSVEVAEHESNSAVYTGE